MGESKVIVFIQIVLSSGNFQVCLEVHRQLQLSRSLFLWCAITWGFPESPFFGRGGNRQTFDAVTLK